MELTSLSFKLNHKQEGDRVLAARVEESPLSQADFAEIQAVLKQSGTSAGAVAKALEQAANPASAQSQISEPSKTPRQLTPEQAEITLQTLAARFKANEYLHKGVEWARVKTSLEANQEALWSINEMEKAGHEPDVYNSDEKGFDIGTCSKESPASGRNCVYDEAAEKWRKTNRPSEKFNGSAVAMAEAMGINLMDPNLYKNVLQKKGKFDMQTWSWLLTQLGTRSAGYALLGFRYGYGVFVVRNFASAHNDYGSWRGSLRVEWAA